MHAHRYDVFIAYAGPDQPHARDLYNALAPKWSVFFDREVLRPGDRWMRVLPAAVQGSRIVAVLVSSNLDANWYTDDEVARAIKQVRKSTDKGVVPIILDDSPLPYGLEAVVTIEARGKTTAQIAAALERILT